MDYPRASVSPKQYRGIAGSGDEIVARIANFLLFTNSTQSLISKEDWIELLICSRDVFLKPKNLTAAILERPPGRLRLYTNHSLECAYGAPFRPKIVEKNSLVENRQSCVEKNLHVVKSAKNDETISSRFHLPYFV